MYFAREIRVVRKRRLSVRKSGFSLEKPFKPRPIKRCYRQGAGPKSRIFLRRTVVRLGKYIYSVSGRMFSFKPRMLLLLTYRLVCVHACVVLRLRHASRLQCACACMHSITYWVQRKAGVNSQHAFTCVASGIRHVKAGLKVFKAVTGKGSKGQRTGIIIGQNQTYLRAHTRD